MKQSEELVRNVAVFIFLAILFPSIGIFAFDTFLQAITIGLITAVIVTLVFAYLERKIEHGTS